MRRYDRERAEAKAKADFLGALERVCLGKQLGRFWRAIYAQDDRSGMAAWTKLAVGRTAVTSITRRDDGVYVEVYYPCDELGEKFKVEMTLTESEFLQSEAREVFWSKVVSMGAQVRVASNGR